MKRKLAWASLLLTSVLLIQSSTLTLRAEDQPVQTLPLPTVAGKDLTQEIEENKQALQQKREEMENLRQKSASLTRELEALQADSESITAEKEKIVQQIEFAQETLNQRAQESQKAMKQLEAKEKQYQARLASMFYYRMRSWWEVLLSSNGLEGFFSNLRMIQAIAQSDKSMIEELRMAREVAEKTERLAEKTRDSYERFLQDKETQLQQLSEGIVDRELSAKELDDTLKQRGSEEEDLERTLAEQMAAQAVYEENSRQLAAQIAKVEQQNREILAQAQANQSGNAPASTDPAASETPNAPTPPAQPLPQGPSSAGRPRAVWPIPGFTDIWSPYGPRNFGGDSINGYVHTGVDISGANAAGTPIVAAWSGVVVTANAPSQGQMYSPNANYVQINHGNGLGSGYWHLLDVVVQVGQTVQAGQLIGHCGSTGMSTGPHLHFEVYDQNNPNRGIRNTCNPMPYLQ